VQNLKIPFLNSREENHERPVRIVSAPAVIRTTVLPEYKSGYNIPVLVAEVGSGNTLLSLPRLRFSQPRF
jgi:hypothetical protein